MFVERELSKVIVQHRDWYPIIYLGGPRQSGKTTLLLHLFPDSKYASLEDPDMRLLAEEDPRRFLNTFPNGGILDEVQRVPVLFSYLQGLVDGNKSLHFLLSGSQNFLMMESISQSLAGRVGLLNLLPFGYPEIASIQSPDLLDFVWRGGYPGLFEKKIPPDVFFNNHLQTYLERDVRQLKNVGDLFLQFAGLCDSALAGSGSPQYVNLATDAGISVNTVKAWLSVLEPLTCCFFLPAYHSNFNKRIIKAPKIYFFDTGFLCYLLGISAPEQLETHHYFGNIFKENAVIAELYKKRSNAGKRPTFWFWQDQHRNEVDLLIEEGGKLRAVEIKSSQTYNSRLVPQA